MVSALRLASDLVSRAGLAMRAGLQFGGLRDLYAALGYKRDLTAEDYRARYNRGGIARRIVRALPEATWRGGAELIEDEDPLAVTEFEEAWDELEDRLHVWQAFARADVLAGMGRYAGVLVGAPGELVAPLPKSMKPEDIAYLMPYGEDDLKVYQLVDDPLDPRFGKPLTYTLRRSVVQKGAVARTFERQVNWERVLHVADDVLDDGVYGSPRLEPVWNYLDDLDKISGGGAESFWLRANQGLIFNADKDLELNADDIKKTQETADEFVHSMRRTMAVRGMEVTPLGSDVANTTNPIDAALTLIAGTTGIPKRILMGSERGELASTQDRENWEQRIRDRRHDFAEPVVVRTFVDLLVDRGVLPEPEQYEVRWPDMESLTKLEQAQVATQWAGLNTAAGSTVVLPEEIRDRVLRLEPIPEEDLAAHEEAEAEKAAQALKDQQELMKAKAGAPGPARPGQAGPSSFGKPKAARSGPRAPCSNGRLHDAMNPCHDPGTGQFCGGPSHGGAASSPLTRPSGAFPPARPGGADTLAMHTTADGRLTPERQRLHDAIVAEHFVGKRPVADPETVMLGGGPASGKSTVAQGMGLSDNYVHVDVDQVRTRLPEYKEGVRAGRADVAAFTHEESSMIAKRISGEAVGGKYNVLVDGTGDNSYDGLKGKIATYRKSGGRVRGVYVTIDTETAVVRAAERGKKTGRYVPEEFIRQSHAGVSSCFSRAVQDGLFDSAELWDTRSRQPFKVVTARGSNMQVHNVNAWTQFLAKARGGTK